MSIDPCILLEVCWLASTSLIYGFQSARSTESLKCAKRYNLGDHYKQTWLHPILRKADWLEKVGARHWICLCAGNFTFGSTSLSASDMRRFILFACREFCFQFHQSQCKFILLCNGIVLFHTEIVGSTISSTIVLKHAIAMLKLCHCL